MVGGEILTIFTVVVLAVVIYCGVDLFSERKQISNMIGALLLIVLGATFILVAVGLWLQVEVTVITMGGKEYMAVLTEDFSKIAGAVGFGTVGMAIVTGGFSLISGGKYEVKVSSTEPIQGVEVKK